MAQKGTSSYDPSLVKANEVVDLIVTRIETKFTKFNISEIIKAGSLGHGTAVPGHYDIDLVIYSQDISAEAVYRENGFERWVDMLKVFMEEEFKLRASTPGYNHRSVQFSIRYENVVLQVDLLVSPYWNDPKDFYNFLRRIQKEKRTIFTICASKWQVEFFKKVHVEKQEIKEYIRRAKAWRNKTWNKDSDGKPSSYLMSLLVLKAYEIATQKQPIGIAKALKRLVTNFHSMDVYWDGYFYNRGDYDDIRPHFSPRIIDPANPSNNVWESGFRGSCMVLVSKIDSIDLSQPV